MFLKRIQSIVEELLSPQNYARFLKDLLDISLYKNVKTIKRHRFVNALTAGNLVRFIIIVFISMTFGPLDCGVHLSCYDYAFLSERIYNRYLLISSVVCQSIFINFTVTIC